jgi:hypothetical protein
MIIIKSTLKNCLLGWESSQRAPRAADGDRRAVA